MLFIMNQSDNCIFRYMNLYAIKPTRGDKTQSDNCIFRYMNLYAIKPTRGDKTVYFKFILLHWPATEHFLD